MTRKTILITGCSSGLGAALAIAAARAGHSVHATMRNVAKRDALDTAAAAADVTLSVHRLDVRDQASIDDSVAAVLAADGRLDTLIANAGMGYVIPVEEAPDAEVDRLFDTNVRGLMRCVRAVLPVMRRQRAGHVVAVSSVGGLVGQPFNELYCATKFAVEGFIESLASYVGPAFGIDFTLVEPGGIASDFAATVLKDLQARGGFRNDDYGALFDRYRQSATTRSSDGVYQTSEQVAEVVLAAIAAARPPVRVRTSLWAEQLCRLKTEADPDGHALRAKVAADFLGLDVDAAAVSAK